MAYDFAICEKYLNLKAKYCYIFLPCKCKIITKQTYMYIVKPKYLEKLM